MLQHSVIFTHIDLMLLSFWHALLLNACELYYTEVTSPFFLELLNLFKVVFADIDP